MRNTIDNIINDVLNEEFNKRSSLLYEKKMKNEVKEKLVGKQSKIDKNKNGKIDAEDFKMLKNGKKEVKEKLVGKQGKIDKNKNGKIDAEDFKMLKKGKKSVKMDEEALISFIQDIILEATTDNAKAPKSMADVQTLLKKSKKQSEENIANVGKKMKEYLKYGSDGEYVANPKNFPMTNGQLKKSDIKGYRMDDSEEEFLENIGRGGGMENLVYDEMAPDEEWVKDNIKGSSRTGNNPEWANGVKTDINDNVNKKRENNYYGKEKKRAYQKSQDVHIVQDGDERPAFMNKVKKESTEENSKMLKEEFSKMQNLMNYNKKTQ
jgi:hypothetical protein